MTTAEHSFADSLGPFFGVVVRGRTYLNAVYNLLAFPLGVGYFVFLVVGLSLGFGLLIIWVGVIVLAGVLLLSWGLSAFERQQAILLLGATIGPMGSKPAEKSPVTAWMKAFLGNRVTWTGPIFLFLKFPLGLFSFVFAIVSLSISFSLVLAPIYYYWSPLDFLWWYVDTLPEALVCSLIGILVFILSLHALNGLAWIWRELASLMLGTKPDLSPTVAGDVGSARGSDPADVSDSAVPA